jgi:hypothetical protein
VPRMLPLRERILGTLERQEERRESEKRIKLPQVGPLSTSSRGRDCCRL